jgi:hypothetical protein
MTGFETDPSQLHTTSGSMRDLVDAFAGESVLRFSIRAAEAGHPELNSALETFQHASSASTTLISEDIGRLADRLSRASRRYHEFERAAVGALAAPVDSQPAPPAPPVWRTDIEAVLG